MATGIARPASCSRGITYEYEPTVTWETRWWRLVIDCPGGGGYGGNGKGGGGGGGGAASRFIGTGSGPTPQGCPNVSVQEWNLGQQAITLTKQGIGVEEGYMIFSDGTVQRMIEPNFRRGPDYIKLPPQLPSGVVALVHSHPSGSGVDEGDLAIALLHPGVRVISAGRGTNLYGVSSWPPGGTPFYSNCPLPNGP